MYRATVRLVVLLACSLLALAASRNRLAAAEPLQAGVAVVDITPPVPYRMSGYFSERLSTGIKDPLYTKAVVFRQGKETGALVFSDLIGLSPAVARAARQRAEQELGIPAAHIVLAATHSHTGPLYFGALREHFHRRVIKQQGTDPYEVVNYPDQLVARLVAALRQAHESLRPVSLRSGYASETRLAFNRRFHMKDGTVRFNPGQQNPDIVRVAGPIDPQVGIVLLDDATTSRPQAGIISYALHLDTVGGTEYSGDYPKYLQDRLRQSLGDDFVSLFGAGTCGDINHVDVRIRGRRSAAEIGTLLGDTVAAAVAQLKAEQEGSLAVRRTTVTVPLQRYSDREITQAAADMQRVEDRTLSFLDRVRAYKISALQLRGGTEMDIEVQAFRLGKDTALVALPGEVFVELGLAIKAASPFATTLVIELANDTPGYLPTKKAFAEGSYETVNSRIAPGGGEAMVAAAIGLLEELARP